MLNFQCVYLTLSAVSLLKHHSKVLRKHGGFVYIILKSFSYSLSYVKVKARFSPPVSQLMIPLSCSACYQWEDLETNDLGLEMKNSSFERKNYVYGHTFTWVSVLFFLLAFWRTTELLTEGETSACKKVLHVCFETYLLLYKIHLWHYTQSVLRGNIPINSLVEVYFFSIRHSLKDRSQFLTLFSRIFEKLPQISYMIGKTLTLLSPMLFTNPISGHPKRQNGVHTCWSG